MGVRFGPETQGGIVRRNTFAETRFEMVKDLGRDSLIGGTTTRTEWHRYWGQGLNIELLPGLPWPAPAAGK